MLTTMRNGLFVGSDSIMQLAWPAIISKFHLQYQPYRSISTPHAASRTISKSCDDLREAKAQTSTQVHQSQHCSLHSDGLSPKRRLSSAGGRTAVDNGLSPAEVSLVLGDAAHHRRTPESIQQALIRFPHGKATIRYRNDCLLFPRGGESIYLNA